MVEQLGAAFARLREQIQRRIVGQDAAIEQLAICLLARGHALLVGVPGIGKTLTVSTLSDCLGLSFRRIQFTPDLMPSDILGTEVMQEDPSSHRRQFKFLPGPVFANAVLADEINRTPPKTQAALLETMQERQVSIGGQTYPLDEPFFVLATQNPIEQEGTYPLPEAQLDRFLLEIHVGYPTAAEEIAIMQRGSSEPQADVQPVLTREEILAYQSLVRRVPIGPQVLNYAAALVRKSRPEDPTAPAFVRQWLSWGAGPRASIHLVLAAKARALLRGEYAAGWDDIDAVAAPVLRHRLILNFAAQAETVSPDSIVARLIEETPKTVQP